MQCDADAGCKELGQISTRSPAPPVLEGQADITSLKAPALWSQGFSCVTTPAPGPETACGPTRTHLISISSGMALAAPNNKDTPVPWEIPRVLPSRTGAKAATFSLHTSSCVCAGGACILRVSQQADLQGLPCPHVQGGGWGSQVSALSLLKPTAPALALSPTSALPGVWSLLLPFSLLGWVWASRCHWPGGPPHLFGSCTLPATL